MSGIMATTKHLRQELMCAAGAREFCQKYGLSWQDFFTVGLPVEAIEATGDALGIRVAARARQEAGK